jgi:hypothetical protein
MKQKLLISLSLWRPDKRRGGGACVNSRGVYQQYPITLSPLDNRFPPGTLPVTTQTDYPSQVYCFKILFAQDAWGNVGIEIVVPTVSLPFLADHRPRVEPEYESKIYWYNVAGYCICSEVTDSYTQWKCTILQTSRDARRFHIKPDRKATSWSLQRSCRQLFHKQSEPVTSGDRYQRK